MGLEDPEVRPARSTALPWGRLELSWACNLTLVTDNTRLWLVSVSSGEGCLPYRFDAVTLGWGSTGATLSSEGHHMQLLRVRDVRGGNYTIATAIPDTDPCHTRLASTGHLHWAHAAPLKLHWWYFTLGCLIFLFWRHLYLTISLYPLILTILQAITVQSIWDAAKLTNVNICS